MIEKTNHFSLSKNEARRITSDFSDRLGNNTNLQFIIVENPSDIYGSSYESDKTIKGSYHSSSENDEKGKIVLVTSNHDSFEDFQKSLKHEVLGHHGLNTYEPHEKLEILESIIKGQESDSLKQSWSQTRSTYKDYPLYHQAEEVFALVAEDIKLSRIDGIPSLDNVKNEVLRIVTEFSEGDRKQKTFPTSDKDQFRIGTESASLYFRSKFGSDHPQETEFLNAVEDKELQVNIESVKTTTKKAEIDFD